MITAGILGGDTFAAGELIRLLINHPDIESLWVAAPALAGRPVTSVHYGLDGETDLTIIAPEDAPADTDVVFDCTDPLAITVVCSDATDTESWVLGLPELNRKALVRGARKARIPHPAVIAAAIPLLPLARKHLLTAPIQVNVAVPEEFNTAGDDTSDILAAIAAELQPAFSSSIEFKAGRSAHPRVLTATVSTECAVDATHIADMFHEFYDDHNLTRFIGHTPTPHDVANTGKCLVHIAREGQTLTVTTALDALVKGTAGTAVHVMNLLFGLDERIALNLKASGY